MMKATLMATVSGLMLNPAFSLPIYGSIRMEVTPAEQVLAQLEERRQALVSESQEILNAADLAGVDLSDEQLTRTEQISADLTKIDKQIAARKTLAPQPQGRKTSPEPTNRSGNDNRVPAQPRNNDPRRGFTGLGDFAHAVRAKEMGQSEHEGVRKLMAAATTYGNEGTGAEGGDLVPPEFSKDLWTKVQAEENLLNRCSPLVVGGNSITIPKDETTPWQSSGGVQVYWEAEAAAVTASKPAFEPSTIRLAKLMALINVSDELLEDATALDSWLRAKTPAKMAAKINTSIISGTGVGQPLGILTSPSVISVAKETSQPAATVYFANVNKMWSRMYAPWRRNAIWLINQDIEPQLNGMAFDPAATSKTPAYLPVGGLSVSPYATLMGRPVVPVEACSTLGAQGDIILCDLNQYWALTKAAGIRTDVSMHLYFDQGLQSFRFTFRLNGQPAWSAAITPQNGSNTRSWAVTLDAR